MPTREMMDVVNAVRMGLLAEKSANGAGGANRPVAHMIAAEPLQEYYLGKFQGFLLNLAVDAVLVFLSSGAMPLRDVRHWTHIFSTKFSLKFLKAAIQFKDWADFLMNVQIALVEELELIPSFNPSGLSGPFNPGNLLKKAYEVMQEEEGIERFLYPQTLPQGFYEDIYCGGGTQWSFYYNKATRRASGLCIGRVPCYRKSIPALTDRWVNVWSDATVRDFAIHISGSVETGFKTEFAMVSHYKSNIQRRSG